MIWLGNNLFFSLLFLYYFSQFLYRFLFFKACCFFLLFKTFLYNSEQSVFHIQKCLGIFAAKCTSCNAWYILLCISHLILSDHSVNLSIDQQIITECKVNFAVSDIPPAVFVISKSEIVKVYPSVFYIPPAVCVLCQTGIRFIYITFGEIPPDTINLF